MMLDEIDLIKKIFECVESEIEEDYDAFTYTVEVHDNYQEARYSIIKRGVVSKNPKLRDGESDPYELIEELNKNAALRGEKWKSMTISYERGGDVKTKFNY